MNIGMWVVMGMWVLIMVCASGMCWQGSNEPDGWVLQAYGVMFGLCATLVGDVMFGLCWWLG